MVIPLILAMVVFCHQYNVGEKASKNVIIYSYMHYCSVNSCCFVFETTLTLKNESCNAEITYKTYIHVFKIITFITF